jgi:hypothetical protein
VNVRFFDFSRYHGKYPDSGSTVIRVNQLIKYWPEAGKYLFGENPDVLIFQKVYTSPDYKFHAHFKGIKILDICDPDWLGGGTQIKETIDAVDAVVCSSNNLRDFIRQMTDKPVITIKDRFDLSELPPLKQHTKDATTVVWFGYRHNAETLKPAMKTLSEMNLNLIVIAEDDPLAWQWLPRLSAEKFRTENYKYIKHTDNIYSDLQKADFCLLPVGGRPIDRFKSNNKTTKAILSGLPVAKDADALKLFISAEERNKYLGQHYEATRAEYDVKKSVEEYKALIEQIKANKKA